MATIEELMDEYKNIEINGESIRKFMEDNGLQPDDSINELQKRLREKNMKECHEADLYMDEKIMQRIWDICEEFNVSLDFKWDYKE